MQSRPICFSEDEAFDILWALDEAKDRAFVNDALADVVLFEGVYLLVRRRIDEGRSRD